MKIGKIASRFILLAFIAAMGFLSNQVSAQSRVWNLEDCINYAFENNIQIKQSELSIKTSEINLLEGKLSLLPNINGDANYSYNWGRVLDQTKYEYINRETKQGNFSLDANFLLFAGLQKMNNVKKLKIDFLTSQYAADKMKDDISLLLTQAYLSILFNKELLRVAREQVQITKEQGNRTSKMVEAGTLARGSLLEIQAQNAREEINVINYENSLELAYLDLLQILDMPADTDFEIEIPVLDLELTEDLLPVGGIYEYALLNQPSIKGAELQVESALKNVSIAKGRMSPTLNLVSGWSTNYSNQPKFDTTTLTFQDIPFEDQFSDNQSRYLAFALNIPIFNGYQVSSNISRAKIMAEDARYNYELTKNNLRKTIEQAYSDARAGYKTYTATSKSLTSFEESFRYTEQKFNVGLTNSVDYNLAKTQLTAAESELVRAKYDYIFKTKILDFYMGKPLVLTN